MQAADTKSVSDKNSPSIRLAIIAEESTANAANDLLTAEFSKRQHIHLLERAEIERAYREQALSTGNRDYLKLGQILGADGLLILSGLKEGTNQFLQVRLVAVRPGVVIGSVHSAWPLTEALQWAKWISHHFEPLLPKLKVLAKDAIPISVVNLRSAVGAPESEELERQLTLLTIDRLSREPVLFVLERRRMELLTEEKEFAGVDDAKFWNGSYLLEGAVDPEGYDKRAVSLRVQLKPRTGGTPITVSIGGNRTNLAEVVNQLADAVAKELKINNLNHPWIGNEEAAQYFEEANWALKWGAIQQALAASESAWALGRRDIDCALARVRSYVQKITAEVPPDLGQGDAGSILYVSNSPQGLRNDVENLQKTHPLGGLIERRGNLLEYFFLKIPPEPAEIDDALRALSLYLEFSRTLPDTEPKSGSPWYKLGAEALNASSLVLQHFYCAPASAKTEAYRIAELRALARATSAWISRSPSVRSNYWVGDRVATHDELAHTVAEVPNIFRSKIDFGCFWQDHPEDCIALYRELMTSPVFCYLHQRLWYRHLTAPRLVAWNVADKQGISDLWRRFEEELRGAQNYFLRLEGAALKVADARTEQDLGNAFNEFFSTMFTNVGAFVTNNVELLYLNWETDDLVNQMGHDLVSAKKEKLWRFWYSEYRPRLEEMDKEYWNHTKDRFNWALNLSPPGSSNPQPTAVASSQQSAVQKGPTVTSRDQNQALVTNVVVAGQYWKIPIEKLQKAPLGELAIYSHRWRGPQLWLDLRYIDRAAQNTYWDGHGAAAALNPTTGDWQILRYPSALFAPHYARGGLYFEIFRDSFFLSTAAGIQKYDLHTLAWTRLELPIRKLVQLFAFDNRLFAADDESILELAENGQGMRVLASCRRRPIQSTLDSLESFGRVVVFPGLNHALRASIGESVYTWDGRDWRSEAVLGFNVPLEVFETGTILRSEPAFRHPVNIWLWHEGQPAPELIWHENWLNNLTRYSPPGVHPAIRPFKPEPGPQVTSTWKERPDFSLAHAAVALRNSNLVFAIEDYDRPATLVYLDRDCSEPLLARVDFGDEPLHPRKGASKTGSRFFIHSGIWMVFANDLLLLGRNDWPGVYAISSSQLDRLLKPHKESLQAHLKSSRAADDQHSKESNLPRQ